MSTNAQIIEELAAHVRSCGGSYSSWYVGVASKPRERLFNDHNVSEQNGSWIFRTCASSGDARMLEKHFLDKGMQGGGGGGDYSTTAVYAYKITSSTRE